MCHPLNQFMILGASSGIDVRAKFNTYLSGTEHLMWWLMVVIETMEAYGRVADL